MIPETGLPKIMILQVHIIHDAPEKAVVPSREGPAMLATDITVGTSTNYEDWNPIPG